MNVIPGVSTSVRVMLEVVVQHVDGSITHLRARPGALKAALDCRHLATGKSTRILFSRQSAESEWTLACIEGKGLNGAGSIGNGPEWTLYLSPRLDTYNIIDGRRLSPGTEGIPVRHGMRLVSTGNFGCVEYEVRLSWELARGPSPKLDVPDLNLEMPSELAPSPEVIAGWQELVKRSIERANKHVDVEEEEGPGAWQRLPAQIGSAEWKSGLRRR